MKRFLLSFLFIGLFAIAFGQLPQLLKDINPGAGSSIPQFDKGAISWNGKIYFAAGDSTKGVELWVTDGTSTGTVLLKDINPGASSSDCQNFFPASNFIYFTANDGAHGLELWRTDGTEAGTQIVKDIRAGSPNGVYVGSSSQPKRLYVWNDELYFSANEGTNGVELWKSDGTDAGTVLVKNINTASFDSYPVDFELYNGKLYFQARNSSGSELWVTDGTNNGTVQVKDINVGAFGSGVSDLVSCNGYLLFVADDDLSQQELWRSDGTTDGTVLVKDIDTTLYGSGMQTQPNSFEKRLVKIGDVVYFSADDAINGRELWRSDGTETGTYMVKDASTDPDGYAPQKFAVLNDVLYYKYDDDINGIELWRSDGTENGTYMVKDCRPGSFGSFFLPSYIDEAGGGIWFGAEGSNTKGKELWISDGTEVGTIEVADINPGSADSNPYQFISLNDIVLFAATGPQGTELYKIDLNVVPLAISLSIPDSIICNGDATGSLALNILGGVFPYTITWNPSNIQGTNPSDLAAGTYSVTVSDATGTTATSTFEITQPTPITTTTSSIAATHSNANGSASVSVTGGTPPYSYQWVNGSMTPSISNIVSGDYIVTVMDAFGCAALANVTVDMETGVDEVLSNIIQVTPTLSNGQFTILSNLPLSDFQISLMDNQGRVLKEWDTVSIGQVLAVEQPIQGLFYLKIKAGERLAIKKIVFSN